MGHCQPDTVDRTSLLRVQIGVRTVAANLSRAMSSFSLMRAAQCIAAVTSLVAGASCTTVGCPEGMHNVDGVCTTLNSVAPASDAGTTNGTGAQMTSGSANAQGNMAGTSSTASGARAGASGTTPAAGPCSSRPGQSVCDGAVLHTCGSDGSSTAQETCSTAMSCQLGLATGACAACSPGTFRCTGENLEQCNSSGSYVSAQTCTADAPCNATAGACTATLCVADSKVCSADGTLQLCSSDGSKLTDLQACGQDLCDAVTKQCLSCVPESTSCEGEDLVQCSPDGSSSTVGPCMQEEGSCKLMTCQSGNCAPSNQPEGTTCAKGVCDSQGACVGCLGAADCASGEVCVDNACITEACEPKATTCTSDGTLQTCNDTGTAVASMKKCGRGLCDADGAKCFKCMPNTMTCSGNAAVVCDSSGEEQRTACSATNNCTTAACSAGECTSSNKAAGTSCGSMKCDGNGGCNWECADDGDCESNEYCEDHMCASKCGNGRIDPGESCDTKMTEWGGFCTSQCEVSAAVYAKCETAGASCGPGGPFFCSPTGSCTHVCTRDSDCAVAGKRAVCADVSRVGGTDDVCTIDCGSGQTCGSGLSCKNVGSATDTSRRVPMCGTTNVDLEAMMPW